MRPVGAAAPAAAALVRHRSSSYMRGRVTVSAVVVHRPRPSGGIARAGLGRDHRGTVARARCERAARTPAAAVVGEEQRVVVRPAAHRGDAPGRRRRRSGPTGGNVDRDHAVWRRDVERRGSGRVTDRRRPGRQRQRSRRVVAEPRWRGRSSASLVRAATIGSPAERGDGVDRRGHLEGGRAERRPRSRPPLDPWPRSRRRPRRARAASVERRGHVHRLEVAAEGVAGGDRRDRPAPSARSSATRSERASGSAPPSVMT